MTFKELRLKLTFCIQYKGKYKELIDALNELEVSFDKINEIEYGFYLARAFPNANSAFDLDVDKLIEKYAELSENDRKRAYIYVGDSTADNPVLYLGLK